MAWLAKRNLVYYIKFVIGRKKRKLSTGTDNYQLAKEKLRQFGADAAREGEPSLPTKTSIPKVLDAYVQHIRAFHSAKSAQSDIYYLRDAFGPVGEGLKNTSRKPDSKPVKRKDKPGQDRRRKAPVIEAECFERITTTQVAAMISGHVANRGLAPRTANRFREILLRLFNWASTNFGVKMPHDKNPVARVPRHKERAPEIRFLTLEQVGQQLNTFEDNLQLQAMVATLIYAGIRREELLWLTLDDLDLSTGKYGMLRIRAKTIDGESWQPKTKKNRAVPISSSLRVYLDKWKLKRGGVWLFPSPAAGKRWDTDNFSRSLRTVNEKIELPWGCLDFRHTFGSQLAMKGESLYKISALMGNSPEICQRHYAALVPEAMADTVEFGVVSPTHRPASAASA